MKIERNIPLGPLTTLKIGGPARFFATASTERHVGEALSYANENGLDVFILGGGSNVLIADAGFDGLVLHIGLGGISTNDASDDVRVTAGAGEDWDRFVAFAVGNDLAGVECLSGIPGRVGATPVQNVGAYGQEVSETITAVRCFDRLTGNIVDLTNGDCEFGYRTSIFNSSMKERYIVLSVTYRLRCGGPPKIAYKDLNEAFEGHRPTLRETRDAVLRIRAAKSMVIDPADPNSRSSGSFFKNPIIGREMLADIERRLDTTANVPYFDAGPGMVKIPAAWLIENAGFYKGYEAGETGISTRHSLAIINRGHANAADILRLMDRIVEAVDKRFGIELKPEPVFVGF